MRVLYLDPYVAERDIDRLASHEHLSPQSLPLSNKLPPAEPYPLQEARLD